MENIISFKLQLNGESTSGIDLEKLKKEGMWDCEYEFDMKIPESQMIELQNLLDRIVDKSNDEIFNWFIVYKQY